MLQTHEKLKKLRIERGLSQSQLAEILKNYDVGVDMEGDNGRQTISQLETNNEKKKNRNLTVAMATAYAKEFDVTLDYLFGLTDDYKHEYTDVKDVIGLSDKSILVLEILNSNIFGHLLQTIDFIIDDVLNSSDLIKYEYEKAKILKDQKLSKEDIETKIGKLKNSAKSFKNSLLENLEMYFFARLYNKEDTISIEHFDFSKTAKKINLHITDSMFDKIMIDYIVDNLKKLKEENLTKIENSYMNEVITRMNTLDENNK